MVTKVDKQLILRLMESGIEASMIPGFIRSLVNASLLTPGIPHNQVNERLKYLGWHDVEIDYHTLQLAINSLETKGLKQLEYKSAPWYLKRFESGKPVPVLRRQMEVSCPS